MKNTIVNFDCLVGKTFVKVQRGKGPSDPYFSNDDGINFFIDEKNYYRLYHSQDCCEWVHIEDICGELSWLEGSPIITAREDTNRNLDPVTINPDSYTWTFYNIATAKGHVTIRWYGESNGYYSESVELIFINPSEENNE